MEIQVHYELAAVMFMIAATLVFFRQRHLRVYRSSLFFWLMVLGAGTAVLDVFCGIVTYHPVPVWLGVLVQSLFLISSLVYSVNYSMYAMELLRRLDFVRKYRLFWCIPFVLGVIMVVATPFTGLLYRFDAQGVFYKNAWYYLVTALSFVYLFVPLILMHKVSFVSGRIKKWIIVLPVVTVTAKILQYTLFPDFLFVYAVNSVMILCCYLFLQNSDYFMDEVTGFFKMHGFEETVREKMAYKEECSVLIIRIINFNAMTEMYEDSKLTAIQAAMAELMQKECGDKDYYHIAASTFAILLPNEKETREVHQRFVDVMPKIWTIDGEEIVHEYCFYEVNIPDACESVDELLQRVAYARSDHQGHHKTGELIPLTHDAVKPAEEKQKVAELVEQAVVDNSIEIYFQPIYSLEKGRVTSLEVLSRLKDKDKNFINPEFFIHVAEENRDIIALGEQIYRKACIFATQNHIFDMGIDDININLSPVQCCYEELAQNLIRIAGEYDIPMSRMHLEITESGIMDKEEIRETLETLRSSGAKIALDDFGTGYSNVSSIVSLPVDFVKIDKSLVWSYGRGENKYLDQLVPMIHAEGKRIISEGIETQEHIDIFKRLQGDFLQGYFYSKPLPEREFLQYLREANQISG